MSQKTYIPSGETVLSSQIGATLEALAGTIAARREAGEESYTYRLLTGSPDVVLKKVMEEAGETALAAKDVERDGALANEVDHLRYEAGDVVYHLLVLLERCGVDLDEFAAEMNTRMTEDEIALRSGVIMLKPDFVNRGSNH